ncbi:MAG: zinc ribbon domain-containing protein [Proteobacteria bacterium]|nr:zinc ribbon domain-containing protein [Pseudomonadota bacterium]
MPIYEYKCGKCSKQFEVFQGISDPAVTSCRFCSGRVRKLMSLSSFHLKGSGWYATDYSGKKAPGGEKKKDAPEAEKSQSPSETKSE